MYLYPVGLAAFVFSVAQNEHPLFRFAWLLLLLAIWLYPANNENILENRLTKTKNYPGRIIASVFVAIISIIFIGSWWVKAPTIHILSETNTTQTGGLYEVRIEAVPTTKVLIDSKEAESLGNNIYKTAIDIKNRTNKVLVHAENSGKITEQEITITRAPNNEELAAIEKNKQEAETQRIALEKTKAEELQKQQEELRKQQAEEARCMKDPKCRKQKEDEKSLQEMIAKDAQLEEWIKKNGSLAYVTCKNVVKSQLKSPSTADFPWADYKAWAAGGFLYVHSYVDAQNGFWAQIRTNFTCKFELQNEDLNLVDLKTN